MQHETSTSLLDKYIVGVFESIFIFNIDNLKIYKKNLIKKNYFFMKWYLCRVSGQLHNV
jgi:hypothetical protein